MAQNQPDEAQVQDEFENPAAGPIGLHRGQRSWWARALPFVVTFIVAIALAMGTWLWMSGRGKEIYASLTGETSQTSATSLDSDAQDSDADAESSSEGSSTADTDTAESDANSDTSSTDSTESNTQADTATQETSTVNLASEIVVYNGLPSPRPSGFAAKKAAILTSAGYTSVSASNPQNANPSANVVWYKTAADEATAKDVATKLGISNVELEASIASSIAVIFVTQ